MKKIYTAPEVRLVMLGEEIMDGLTQKSVQQGTVLPDSEGTTVNGQDGSSARDIPDAKISGRFWDDEY